MQAVRTQLELAKRECSAFLEELDEMTRAR